MPRKPLTVAKSSDLVGLRLDLDASMIVAADGASITSWSDLSGLGNNATSGTATFRATGLNGKGVVEFNGTTDVLTIAGAALGITGALHVFIVLKTISLGAASHEGRILGNGVTGGHWQLTHYQGDQNFYSYVNQGSNPVQSGPYATGTFHVLSTSWAGDKSPDSQTIRLDGNARLVHDSLLVPSNTADWKIALNEGQGWNGQIARILVFNRKLTQQEEIAVMNMLATQWALTAPTPVTRTSEAQTQNLLLWSEDFSNAAWTKTAGVTATANTTDVPDPNGGNAASKIVYDGSGAADTVRLVQGIGARPATETMSIWARVASGTLNVRLSDNLGVITTYTLTTTWQRISVSLLPAVPSTWNHQFLLYQDAGVNTACTFYVWGAQSVDANWPGPYTKTTGTVVNTGTIRSAPSEFQNFFTWSSDITNAAWITIDQPITKTGGQTDPFAGSNACLLADSAHTGTFRIGNSASVFSNGAFACASCYAKKGTKTWLSIGDGAVGKQAWFDLQNGVVGSVFGTGCSARITPVGSSGWYLCEFIESLVTLAPAVYYFIAPSDAVITYTGDGTGNILIAYPQLVQANWAGTLTPTQGSAIGTSAPIRSDAATRQNKIANSALVSNTGGGCLSAIANMTVTTGQVDPNGGTAATRLNDTAVNANHNVTFNTNDVAQGPTMTFSCYAKAGTKRWLLLAGNNTSLGAWFDLQNGVLGTVQAGVTASIQAIGGGWYRCSISYVSTGQGASTAWMTNADNTGSYLGDGTGTMFIYGPQTTNGPNVPAYVQTTGNPLREPMRSIAA